MFSKSLKKITYYSTKRGADGTLAPDVAYQEDQVFHEGYGKHYVLCMDGERIYVYRKEAIAKTNQREKKKDELAIQPQPVETEPHKKYYSLDKTEFIKANTYVRGTQRFAMHNGIEVLVYTKHSLDTIKSRNKNREKLLFNIFSQVGETLTTHLSEVSREQDAAINHNNTPEVDSEKNVSFVDDFKIVDDTVSPPNFPVTHWKEIQIENRRSYPSIETPEVYTLTFAHYSPITVLDDYDGPTVEASLPPAPTKKSAKRKRSCLPVPSDEFGTDNESYDLSYPHDFTFFAETASQKQVTVSTETTSVSNNNNNNNESISKHPRRVQTERSRELDIFIDEKELVVELYTDPLEGLVFDDAANLSETQVESSQTNDIFLNEEAEINTPVLKPFS